MPGYQVSLAAEFTAGSIALLPSGKYLVLSDDALRRLNADFTEDASYSPPALSRASGVNANLKATSLGVVVYGNFDVAGATTYDSANTNQTHAALFSDDGETLTAAADYGPFWTLVYPGYTHFEFYGNPVVWGGSLYGDAGYSIFAGSGGALYRPSHGKYLDFMAGTFDSGFDATFGGTDGDPVAVFSNGDLLVTGAFASLHRVDADTGALIGSATLVPGNEYASMTLAGRFDSGFLVAGDPTEGAFASSGSPALLVAEDFSYQGVDGLELRGDGDGGEYIEAPDSTAGALFVGGDGGIYKKGAAVPPTGFWTDLVGCTQ